MWIWYLEKFSSIFGLTRRQNTTRPLFVLDYLLVPVHPDPHAFLDVCWGDAVGKIHHKLGELLHIDDVLGIIRVGVDDLCASRDLATDRLNLHRSTIDSVPPPATAAPTGGSACQLQDPTRQEGQVQCRTPSNEILCSAFLAFCVGILL